jgi:hypothetical protein
MPQKIFIISFPDNMQSIANNFEKEINQVIQNKLKEIISNGFIKENMEIKT